MKNQNPLGNSFSSNVERGDKHMFSGKWRFIYDCTFGGGGYSKKNSFILKYKSNSFEIETILFLILLNN